MAGNMLNENVRSRLGSVAPFLSSLKYYFDVNNSYVQQKLKEGEFAPACRDVNAPDLYIPVMSFVTFILLAGLLKGTLGDFTPEALSEVMSRSIVAEVLEVGVIYGVFAMQKVSHELSLLSLVAYSGYKYFGYVNAIDWVFRARQ